MKLLAGYSLLLPFLLLISTYMSSLAMANQFSSGESKVSLVELFTSEGCSSCPPAEKWLNSLKNDPGLWNRFVPVAFHVDYWDYIGWKDPYANSENGVRQRKYKQQGNINTVYTPGMLLDGKEWRKWHYKRGVPVSGEIVGKLDVLVNEDRLKATFTPVQQQPGAWQLNVAVLGFQLKSDVSAGENSGRRLEQEFVVLAHKIMHSADASWKMKMPAVNKDHAQLTGLAVWVNKKGSQTPIQSTGGWLSKSP